MEFLKEKYIEVEGINLSRQRSEILTALPALSSPVVQRLCSDSDGGQREATAERRQPKSVEKERPQGPFSHGKPITLLCQGEGCTGSEVEIERRKKDHSTYLGNYAYFVEKKKTKI